jgi:hypothetical protein
MTRNAQPDPILDNFSHDMYIYGNAESIIDAWRQQGFTHVLLNHRAAGFVLEKAEEQAIFDDAIALLRSISKSPDGSFELLEVPGGEP